MAFEHSQLTENAKIELSEDRIHSLLANSGQLRRSLANGRELANFGAKDQALAKEFDQLMNSNENIDYLYKHKLLVESL